jgi:PIN domain nuclease of toxin-antitoxin system
MGTFWARATDLMLLDTHVLIWLLSGQEEKLSESALSLLRAGQIEIFVSVATVWEMAIKNSLGKLKVLDGLEAALEESRFRTLPITTPIHPFNAMP